MNSGPCCCHVWKDLFVRFFSGYNVFRYTTGYALSEVCDSSGWCPELDRHLRIPTNARQTQIFSSGWSKHGSSWMGTVFKGMLHTFGMTSSEGFSYYPELFGFGHVQVHFCWLVTFFPDLLLRTWFPSLFSCYKQLQAWKDLISIQRIMTSICSSLSFAVLSSYRFKAAV